MNELETKRKKAALAALVFEDRNGPTSSQKTVPEVVKAHRRRGNS
jgi:hypothetical protein